MSSTPPSCSPQGGSAQLSCQVTSKTCTDSTHVCRFKGSEEPVALLNPHPRPSRPSDGRGIRQCPKSPPGLSDLLDPDLSYDAPPARRRRERDSNPRYVSVHTI